MARDNVDSAFLEIKAVFLWSNCEGGPLIELLLYCNDGSPIEIPELASMVSEAGWTCHVARNWLAAEGFTAIKEGALEHDDVAVGWPNNSGEAAEFEKAIGAGDRKQVDDWVFKWKVGAAMWAFNVPFVFEEHAPFESWAAAKKQMGKQYVDRLKTTKSMFVVTNCAGMEFTAAVLGAVALMKDGVIENPERAKLIAAPKGASELATYHKRFPQDE